MAHRLIQLFSPPRRLLALRLGLLLFSPLVVLWACQSISLQSFGEALGWLPAHLPATGITWLLLLLVAAPLTALTRLSGLSLLLSALLPVGLTVVSHYKALINGEPLVLSDLSLAGELGQVAGFAADRISLSLPTGVALGCIALCVLALTMLDILSLRGHTAACLSLRLRLITAGGSLLTLLLVLLALRPYGEAQYKLYPVQGERDLACGVPLSLLCAWYGSQAQASEEYGPQRMAHILEEMEAALAQQPVGEEQPHIIFVMNESFFDITRLPGLTFSQDPLSNYHRLQEQSTYGRFFTITCSGGTGWVEMETFTGVAMEELAGGVANTDLEAGMYEAMPSYVRILQNDGYRTIAFHANDNTLYNRDKNYPHLGFDQVLFYEPFLEGATFSGGYFDDDSTANVLISLFEEYRSQPVFLYAMTMQNHQPYYAGRYETERLEVSSPLLSDADLEMVTSYVSGLYDADQMLGKLVDYFSQVDEPVILIFAGDHIPSLSSGEGETVYSKLGVVPTATSAGWSVEDFWEMLATDYLIWSNDSPGQGEQPNSTTMMGATILELAQVPSSPFFAWLAQARRDTMVFHDRILTVGPDGQIASSDDPDIAAFRSAYQDVIYDLLYGEHYLTSLSGNGP